MLDGIVAERGQPKAIRCDNGPELTSRVDDYGADDLDDVQHFASIHLQIKTDFGHRAALDEFARCGRAVAVKPNQLEATVLELEHRSHWGWS